MCYASAMKMLGTTARLCDHKGCTCNAEFVSDKAKYKRIARRRETRAWKKEL